MILLGLTGGVGMGKSTAATFLQQLQLPVVDTDVLAREVVAPGQPALEEIRLAFGSDMIGTDGELRRDLLAQRVFSDSALRRQLEAILHPRIRARWTSMVEQWREANHRAGVVVIPLLFETAAEDQFDATICVACSPATQRARLLGRGWTESQIDARNAAQWPVGQKMSAATFVLWSEGTTAAHREQLQCIFRSLGLS